MPRRVSASEAKTRFGAMVNWAVERRDDIIVESRGKPKVVIMPFAEYERVVRLRDEARRREALARLERLREKVRARSQGLSAEDADSLADRFTREVIQEMAEEGKLALRDQ